MHQVIIKIPENAYNVAKQKAESRGYLSVEEYVSDWLESDTTVEVPMTPELASALEEGLADIRVGRVVTLDEHSRRHEELRAQWIRAHSS